MTQKEEKVDGFSQVEKSLTASEQFIEKYQKTIVRAVIAVLVILGAFYGWKNFIHEPNVAEAENQIYVAQQYFEADSFNLALNGDGNALGFIDIADQYSSTPSGNLANLYCGVCYLKSNAGFSNLQISSHPNKQMQNLHSFMQLKEFF